MDDETAMKLLAERYGWESMPRDTHTGIVDVYYAKDSNVNVVEKLFFVLGSARTPYAREPGIIMSPLTNPAQAFELIERERLEVTIGPDSWWRVYIDPLGPYTDDPDLKRAATYAVALKQQQEMEDAVVEKMKTRNVEARARLAKGPEQQQEKS